MTWGDGCICRQRNCPQYYYFSKWFFEFTLLLLIVNYYFLPRWHSSRKGISQYDKICLFPHPTKNQKLFRKGNISVVNVQQNKRKSSHLLVIDEVLQRRNVYDLGLSSQDWLPQAEGLFTFQAFSQAETIVPVSKFGAVICAWCRKFIFL